MFKQKKRFIAGAVCPRCGQLDKLVVFTENHIDYRECVSCDFKDEMRFQQPARELETRVNITEEEKRLSTQVLQFDSRGC
ncbi:MAG: YheV family putative metal-binding protein [Cellvibrionaceae bacterium]|nr:YheV family putative metal-binding protein [Cellvibrionaceae bacterium]